MLRCPPGAIIAMSSSFERCGQLTIFMRVFDGEAFGMGVVLFAGLVARYLFSPRAQIDEARIGTSASDSVITKCAFLLNHSESVPLRPH